MVTPWLLGREDVQKLLLLGIANLLHLRALRLQRGLQRLTSPSAVVLCFPPFLIQLPSALFMTAHLGLIAVQVMGSLWIRKLSPDWS